MYVCIVYMGRSRDYLNLPKRLNLEQKGQEDNILMQPTSSQLKVCETNEAWGVKSLRLISFHLSPSQLCLWVFLGLTWYMSFPQLKLHYTTLHFCSTQKNKYMRKKEVSHHHRLIWPDSRLFPNIISLLTTTTSLNNLSLFGIQNSWTRLGVEHESKL